MRLAYELAVGKRVSDPHWYRTRKLLESHSLEVTVKNVQLLANLRALVPQTALGVTGLLDAYQRADLLVSKAKTIKGEEINNLLMQFGVNAHQSTISRWFKSLGGFKKSRQYKPEQLRDILIRAFLYKAQHEESTARPNTVQIAS